VYFLRKFFFAFRALNSLETAVSENEDLAPGHAGLALMKKLTLFFLLCAMALPAQQNRLLMISIDGLDHRWLRDADQLGVKIPTLRRLAREGARADGVLGVVPTVTWPSHTTIVTGVSAWGHGIVSNNQPGKPGQRWWYVEFLKSKTLWELAGEKGLKTAAVWWPVTARGKIDFNLPEFWDDAEVKPYAFAPVARNATPGLVERIQRREPSFGGKNFTDEQAAIAVRVLFETERPDLTLWHLGELDTAQHETGAFSSHAKETLEHQDELLAKVLKVLPERSYVAIVSDHGFETEERLLRPEVLLRQAGIEAKVEVAEGIFGVSDEKAAHYFRSQAGKKDSPIAREVPIEEVRRLAPALKPWTAAFETAGGVMVVKGTGGPALSDAGGRGDHGLWPTRQGYRASFVLWGPEIKPRVLPEIGMLDIAPTLADVLGVKLPRTEGKSLWDQLQ